LIAIMLLAPLVLPVASHATSSLRNAWKAAYPGACQTLVDAANSCVLCHTDVPDVNAYGSAVAGIGTNFVAIGGIDSDGDTRTNAQEIADCTLPGDPTSAVPVDPDSWGLIKAIYR